MLSGNMLHKKTPCGEESGNAVTIPASTKLNFHWKLYTVKILRVK
jgi:hypothetical protein